MAFNIRRIRFLNQFNNLESFLLNASSDYTENLVGNVGDKIKVLFEYEIWWISEATPLDIFDIIGTGNTLSRAGAGSFITDEFVLGDVISFFDFTLPQGYLFEDRIITNITATTIEFDGAAVALGGAFINSKLFGKTLMNSLRFKFGLIGNNESTNYVSKIDGTAENSYTIDAQIPPTGTTPMDPQYGVQSWQRPSDSVDISFNGQLDRSQNYLQWFSVTHFFTILPLVQDGELSNLQNLIAPPLFNSVNSLRYVAQCSHNINLSNPTGARVATIDTPGNGSVGWFNENLNGNAPKYSVGSPTYKNLDTGLFETTINAQQITEIKFKLESSNGEFSWPDTKLVVGISMLPPVADYQQNGNFIDTNFIMDSVYSSVQQVGIPPSTVIKFVSSLLVNPSLIEVTMHVDFLTSDEARLDGSNFVLFCSTGDKDHAATVSDRVTMRVDAREFFFNPDVNNLVFIDEAFHFPHTIPDNNFGLSFDNYAGWIEDGFEVKVPFFLNKDLGGFLSSFKGHLTAWNPTTDEKFRLQTYSFNLANAPLIQQTPPLFAYRAYNILSERSFQLVAGSQFNKAELVTIGPTVKDTVNVVEYEATLGIKANFEEWILQPGADTVFYDVNEPLNGLNKKSSNYSLKEDYVIIVEIEAAVSQIVFTGSGFLNFSLAIIPTTYFFYTQPHRYYDYDLDAEVTPLWDVVISTFNENGSNTSGIIDVSQQMLIRAVFTPLSGTTDFGNPYGIIRINESGGNINTIFELSTFRESIVNNPLIPLDGELYTKLTDDGLTIQLECLIDGSLLDASTNYDISATMRESSNANGIETENDIFIETELDDILIIE